MTTPATKPLAPDLAARYRTVLETMRRESLTPAEVGRRYGLSKERVERMIQYEKEGRLRDGEPG